jgi:hypothetical protein
MDEAPATGTRTSNLPGCRRAFGAIRSRSRMSRLCRSGAGWSPSAYGRVRGDSVVSGTRCYIRCYTTASGRTITCIDEFPTPMSLWSGVRAP